MVAVGSTLPKVTLWENKPEEVVEFPSQGKFIIVGVPGAFTPPCSSQVPGYIANEKQFAAKGISGIYVVAVNDVFVTKAWKKSFDGGEQSGVHFVADWNGEFTKAFDAGFDASGLLGPLRSKRYAAVVENGKVVKVFIENEVTDVDISSADKVLSSL
ncbi:Thioredoxin peroxidase [Schizosaccharomyces pombe]|uniref:Peroxisomal membrane associated protein 20 n=1 Tax=Schizosaccharomyces pombe (strain 972 / ATCC 24843) TaxID=284812 RepID=PMP20_SCHPO|nr:putative thioredoxin peroxidase [Schizosaccharomyces pombe]O14313.2 RecName: Full=Peroxisomal membrane associated protein 20; AltName: Full=Peroxiredoxin homolog pmp20; Short=Prx [Schizosaccharomyces pombe 972h-]CAA20911.1 thioredoxin peroxidase (predicted) [Schizosaccharomyces pombe]|eukprot:NP_587706.1 putative thioredoxin peroxidase [Schizosaccharomyces pombe]